MEKIYDGNPPPHVRGRFLVRRHEFGGLDGILEIDHALGRMDFHTEWPTGSGRSYSQHFAERAFAAGWRLRSHAPQLLNRAGALRRKHALPASWTWPMKSFEVCINFLLTNIASNRPEFAGFSDEDIDAALEEAALPRRLLLNTIRHALVRAYADGLKHVLGRHVPAIFDHPRTKSGPRIPWMLIRRSEDAATEIPVAWTVRRPWWHEADQPRDGRHPAGASERKDSTG